MDQLSWQKGDQVKIPSKVQFHLEAEELFGEDELDLRVDALKLDNIWVRRWFAREGMSLRARCDGAFALSSRLA